jgi:protein-S-isoprenylcysteine O-methyltransferase Ste14
MKLGAIMFRLRMWVQVVIVILGFWAPWIGTFDLGRRISTLEWLALEISRSGLVRFTYVTPIVIVAGALVAAMGAVFRVWGAAYLGYTTVHHAEMQANTLMAAGPYRYVRNPLYLGGWFMILAVSLLMPPTGALFVIVLESYFLLRTIFSEEAFLSAQLGEPYKEYLRAVPRLLPRLRSGLPAAAAMPRWGIALLTELNAIGIFFTLAILSWTYDNLLMIKVVVVVFGISLIVKALMPTRGNAATE